MKILIALGLIAAVFVRAVGGDAPRDEPADPETARERATLEAPADAAEVDDDVGEDGDDEETAVALNALPEGLLEAASAAVPGAEWTAAWSELEHGALVYELVGRVGARSVEVELSPAGELLEVEWDADD